ncbi:MAG: DUF1294 domain-containing protein [Candidatus Faecousia sp.]|nr:DUF1294 domain-containing protein [Candidatus Faecousia sp.]
MKELLSIYLLIINAIAFCLMLIDKYKARKNLWRIPEATLISTALLGGSIGALIGMYTVRHKTRHIKFTVGIPLILLAQIALAQFLLLK